MDQSIRQKAELLLKGNYSIADLISNKSLIEITHELRVHQIELEMQNEDLRRTQDELKETQNKYFELYHFAPVGYFTFDQQGVILQLNLKAAELLGHEIGFLTGKPMLPYLTPESNDLFHAHRRRVLETHQPQSCELTFRRYRQNHIPFYVQMESVIAKSRKGEFNWIHSTITDITDRKVAEQALAKHHHQLEEIVTLRTAELMATNEQLQQEINERIQAEIALQKARNELEQRVQERTAALFESEQRYKRLLESITNYVYTVNIDNGQPVSTTHGPGCLAVTGYTPDEYAADIYLWHNMVHPDDRPAVVHQAGRLIAGQTVFPLEHRIIHKDGTTRWVQNRAIVRHNEACQVIGYEGVIIDITARKQAEQEKDRLLEAVSLQREELRALSGRLAEAQESERKQLARELHDQVGQNLTALGFNLNLVANQLSSNCPMLDTMQTRLRDSLLLLEETSDRIYNVMADLRPPVLDDYGLVATLKWYGQQWAKRTGLTVSVEGNEPAPRLASPIENALFRITQEALTNIAKHAHAKTVVILVKDDQVMKLAIKDDGVGFDWANLILYTERQHWGLITMRERAEAIGGHCEIESHPECGTQVIVSIPRIEM